MTHCPGALPLETTTTQSLCLKQAALGRLQPLSLEFVPGLHVIHCPDEIGLTELSDLVTGLARPKQGRVTLRARSPFADPNLRSHIGSYLPSDGQGSLGDLERTLRTLGLEASRIEAVLALSRELDPALSQTTSTSTLTTAQRACIALAISLTTADPWLLWLVDPLEHLGPAAQSVVMAAVLEASNRIPVVVLTSSVLQAERLGGSAFELAHGILRSHPPAPQFLLQQLQIEGIGLRALSAALLADDSTTQLRFCATPLGQETLILLTSDLVGTSLAIARKARETGAQVFSIRSATVPQ